VDRRDDCKSRSRRAGPQVTGGDRGGVTVKSRGWRDEIPNPPVCMNRTGPTTGAGLGRYCA
jgi:hypothetical protein